MPDRIEDLLKPNCRGRVHVALTEVTTPMEATARLAGLHGDGWVCTTDRVMARVAELHGDGWVYTKDWVRRAQGGALPDGPPLSAEIATNETTAVHLRYVGERWQFAEISDELRDREHAQEGDDYAFDEVFVSNLEAKGTLGMRYRTWWRLDGGVYRPWVARFLGFVSSEVR
jgi:hypothetical protein